MRLVRDDGQRQAALDVPHARRQGRPRTIASRSAPLRNLPVVRDLVTDMRAFFDKWARAKGSFEAAATRKDDFARVEPESHERKLVDEAIECIGCGVCYSSCDVVTWNPDYLGPGGAQPRVDARERRARRRRSASGCAPWRAMPAATPATRR